MTNTILNPDTIIVLLQVLLAPFVGRDNTNLDHVSESELVIWKP